MIATSDPSAPALAADRILRHAAPVPRYTSYPTAPHFHTGVTSDDYAGWLADLPARARLSLYAHLPFCDTLCWFCGCNTKITRRYEPVAGYLATLKREIAAVGARTPRGATVERIHWGGGSPTILAPDDIRALAEATHRAFPVARDAEFAVEIDPRGLDADRIDALAACGLTRVSIGVQDFDPAVQAAINRVQTVDETRRVVDAFRAHDVRSLNIDAMYGLPGQREAQLEHTLDEVVRLAPDRIALFGYAHVPWMKRHQTMIDESALPGVVERHAHAEFAGDLLVAAGYERVGIDHFALPHDAMAEAARDGRLSRNFQGYTVDDADALIGLGASSIGRLPQGYVQNATAIADYERCVRTDGLAVRRGLALTAEDVLRAHVIERLMCDLAFDAHAVRSRFGHAAASVIAEAEAFAAEDVDGLTARTAAGFAITARGRPFARAVAARFDTYLRQSEARHSVAV
jgi:oxygen-independent coproporphyrinogen III oxidase